MSRVVDSPQPAEPLVVRQAGRHPARAGRAAAEALNAAVIQHEYGIFGGRDGADVLQVLAAVLVIA